jgi:hypothetical protein
MGLENLLNIYHVVNVANKRYEKKLYDVERQ